MSKTIKDVFKIWWEDDRKYATPEQAAMQLEYDIKQAIKEAILTEVIGEDDNEWGPEGDPEAMYRNIVAISRNDLRAGERQRLDAWLGLEDTSNE